MVLLGPDSGQGAVFAASNTKKSTSFDMQLRSSSVQVGTPVHADGILKGVSGTSTVLAKNAVVSLSIIQPDGSKAYPTQGSRITTDAGGAFSVDYTPTVAGAYSLTATYSGSRFFSSATSTVTFDATEGPSGGDTTGGGTTDPVAATATSIAMSGASTSQVGSSTSVSGVLKTTAGAVVSGATISIRIANPDGSTASAQATTDASGAFSYAITPSAAGSYSLTASYAGDAQHEPSSASFSLTATAAQTPTPTNPTYDFIVSSSVVKNADGQTVYAGSSFTAALKWACSQANSVVYVPAGTYDITSSFSVASGVKLLGAGSGTDGTVFNYALTLPSYIRLQATNVDNVEMGNFRTTGAGRIEIAATGGSTHSGFLIHDVVADGSAACVYVKGYEKSTLQDISIVRCQGNDCFGMAFWVGGDYTNMAPEDTWANAGWVKNVYFEDCVALRCGVAARGNDYICGFDLAEGANIDGMHLVRCRSDGNWMDGYHFETAPRVYNVIMDDCTANNNGVKGSGCGFIYSPSWGQQVTLNRCTGSGNVNGDVEASHTVIDLPTTY